jgi:hypothetical protein
MNVNGPSVSILAGWSELDPSILTRVQLALAHATERELRSHT